MVAVLHDADLPVARVISPTASMAGWIAGYWFVRDLDGVFAGRTVTTAPVPYIALSIDLGVPNLDEDGRPVPRASLLGVQLRARSWCASTSTRFVMAMLTWPGFARLFPRTGDSAQALVELGAVIGDEATRRLLVALPSSDPSPRGDAAIAAALDRWFTARARHTSIGAPPAGFAGALRQLGAGASVAAAARGAEVQPRTLHRWCTQHLGVGPKALADLQRLHASLGAAQRGVGDPRDGFADEAHQIRSWRRRLGVTPGAYRRAGPSSLVGAVAAAPELDPTFYL